jgi:hypothetical protein
MAGNRTLKLSILADVDNLNKNLKAADQDVSNFGDKLKEFGKKAALAFAAAAASAASASAVASSKDKADTGGAPSDLSDCSGATTSAVPSPTNTCTGDNPSIVVSAVFLHPI